MNVKQNELMNPIIAQRLLSGVKMTFLAKYYYR